jgi:hypothetical protein
MTSGLQELSAYYSNRMSYEEVEGLLARLTGERLLSDQRIEQLVIDQAVEVSQQWAQAAEGAQEGATATPLEVTGGRSVRSRGGRGALVRGRHRGQGPKGVACPRRR